MHSFPPVGVPFEMLGNQIETLLVHSEFQSCDLAHVLSILNTIIIIFFFFFCIDSYHTDTKSFASSVKGPKWHLFLRVIHLTNVMLMLSSLKVFKDSILTYILDSHNLCLHVYVKKWMLVFIMTITRH